MFFVLRPSRQEIEKFTENSGKLALSYGQVGIAQRPSPGFDIDEMTMKIGQGRASFERAKAALVGWTHFQLGWVEIFPRDASVEPGTVVSVLVHHLGFWSLNGCRLVYRVGDPQHGTHFGFAYGTLANHAESGEEIFEVYVRPESNEVVYRIRAASKPRAALARLGYPFVRTLQARFRQDSGRVMQLALEAAGGEDEPRA